MRRLLMEKLINWKYSTDRKPLILKGIRQCGKTHLLKKFGENNYNDIAYFNFEGNNVLQQRFESDLNVNRIITELGILRNKPIIPGKTLIIFDEIQFCNSALTSLKYFMEELPEHHIASAGSLLGIALTKPLSFPVGKVDILTLRPMNFFEFLLAHNEDMLCNYLLELPVGEKISDLFTDKLENYLRVFYITGGMPEVVKKWVDTNSIETVEEVQQRILDAYELDFAKHAPVKDYPKLSLIWNSIPGQLAKENSKFIFSKVKQGYRARDLENALEWLISAGLVYKVSKIEKPFMPLSAYANNSFFKLYMSDTGLLRKMSGLPAGTILEKSGIYKEFKGAITENYVLCELVNNRNEVPFYWKSKNIAEVDFVMQFGMYIIPIEVKSEKNLRSKSLAEYIKRYKPDISIKVSMSNINDNGVKLIPLYMLWKIDRMFF
ncbi:MAG: ATP-binding protein [Candidatus Alkaliphilus sp. MAG34]